MAYRLHPVAFLHEAETMHHCLQATFLDPVLFYVYVSVLIHLYSKAITLTFFGSFFKNL